MARHAGNFGSLEYQKQGRLSLSVKGFGKVKLNVGPKAEGKSL